MLTKAALETLDDPGRERERETTDLTDKRDRMKWGALQVYNSELERPTHLDLGLHGVTRAALRALCRGAVIESSTTVKRKYSYSALSSAVSLTNGEGNNAMSALRSLQKERLIVSRLGFPDRAMEIDREIDLLRTKVKVVREKEEKELLDYRLKMLHAAQMRKQARFEQILAEETKHLEVKLEEEKQKMRRRQQEEFLRVLENASRRALGKIKKCNCAEIYLCKHNKTASYNTRRPTKVVVQYRRNGKRLRQSGRAEEGAAWEEKAKELDEQQQERWRNHVATSIVASPWGANEAVVDQMTEAHKKELQVLYKTHAVKRDVHNKQQDLRRRNFNNTCEAEERKVKMQCRKQALLRSQADAAEAAREAKRQEKVSYKSDGLQNISKNLLGMEFDDNDRVDSDWRPPTTFGLDNSKRLADEFTNIKDSDDVKEISNRILISRKDILKGKTVHDDSDESEEEEEEEGEQQVNDFLEDLTEDEKYKFGETSGSKLMDRIRKKEARRKMREDASSEASGSPRSPRTPGTWQSGSESPRSAPPATPGSAPGETNAAAVSGTVKKVPPSGPFSTPASEAPTAVGGWTGAGGAGASPFGGMQSSFSSANLGFGMAYQPSTSNLFGAQPSMGNLFGAQPSMSNLFGAQPSTTNLFGAQPSTTNLFGGMASASPFGEASSGSLLGGGGFGAFGGTPAPAPAPAAPAPAPAAAAQSTPTGGSNPFSSPAKAPEVSAPPLVPSKPSAPPPSGASPRAGRALPSPFKKMASEEAMLDKLGDVDVDEDVDVDDGEGEAADSSSDEGGKKSKSPSSQRSRSPVPTPRSPSAKKPPITLVNGQLPPDWKLEPEDNIPPSFKPGSVKDEDWKEKDMLLAQTVGMENSYGVPIVIPEESNESYEPDLKAVPTKGILTTKKQQRLKKKDEKAPDDGGLEKKRVSFGDIKMRIYEVEEEEEVPIAIAEPIKGDDDDEEVVPTKSIMVEKPLAKRHQSTKQSGASKSQAKSPNSSDKTSKSAPKEKTATSPKAAGRPDGSTLQESGGGSSVGTASDAGAGDGSPKSQPPMSNFFSPSLMLRGQKGGGGDQKAKWGEDDDVDESETNSRVSSALDPKDKSKTKAQGATEEEDEIARYERELEEEVESLRSQLEEKLSRTSSNGSSALESSAMMNDPVYVMKHMNKDKKKPMSMPMPVTASVQSPAPTTSRKPAVPTNAGGDDENDDDGDDNEDGNNDDDDMYNTSKDQFSELELSKISNAADDSAPLSAEEYCQPASAPMPSPGGGAFGGRSAMMAEALRKYSEQMNAFDSDLKEAQEERNRSSQAASAALMPHKSVASPTGKRPQSPQEEEDEDFGNEDDGGGGGDGDGDDDDYGDDYEDEEEEEE